MEFGSGATAKRADTGETAQLLFFVNQLSQPLFSADSSVPEFEKLDADVVRLAPPRPDVLGFSRYGETLVIKKSAAPIWAAVTFAETLELVARGIDTRLVDERGAAARLQTTYDEMKDPKTREERLAQYRKIAPLQKDPAYMEKMTKALDTMEKQADTLLPQIAAARAVVSKSEQDLASVKTMASGLSAEDKAAPGCYAGGDKVSLSRFRRDAGARLRPAGAPELEAVQPGAPAIGAAGADHCELRAVPRGGSGGSSPRRMHGQQATARVDRQGGLVGVAAVVSPPFRAPTRHSPALHSSRRCTARSNPADASSSSSSCRIPTVSRLRWPPHSA